MFMEHYTPNRCDPRIEVIVKMQNVKKNKSWGSGPVGVGGVKVDVSQELKFCANAKKSPGGPIGRGGGGGGAPVGVRVDM